MSDEKESFNVFVAMFFYRIQVRAKTYFSFSSPDRKCQGRKVENSSYYFT